MVKFRVNANSQGQYYFPKEIREELGANLDVICNAKTAIIYNEKTSLETVLRSLDVLQKDLKNRLQSEREVS